MKLPLRVETPRPMPATIPAPACPDERELAARFPVWAEKPKREKGK